MRTPFIFSRNLLVVLAALGLTLAACAAATPQFGPGSPRNGAGQPVDGTYGTPLPGDAPVNG